MSKGSSRRPTLNKELADKHWAEFDRKVKAKRRAEARKQNGKLQ